MQRLATKTVVFFTALLLVFAAPGPALADEALIVLVGGFSGKKVTGITNLTDGANLAVTDINAKGGLLEKTLRIHLENNSATAPMAERVARKIVVMKPALVLGDTSSTAVMASAPIYAAAGMLQITPMATANELTERGFPRFFRTIGRNDRQGVLTGELLLTRWKSGRIGILYEDTIYGIKLSELVKATLNKGGINEVLFESMNPEAKNFTPLIEKMKNLHLDAVYMAMDSGDAATVVNQMRVSGVSAAIVGSDSLADSGFESLAGRNAENVIFMSLPIPRGDPMDATVTEHFKALKLKPSGYTFAAYAAVEAWAEAVRRAKSFDYEKVAEILHKGRFDTVLGPVSFDAKGDIVGKWAEWQAYIWHDGNAEPLLP